MADELTARKLRQISGDIVSLMSQMQVAINLMAETLPDVQKDVNLMLRIAHELESDRKSAR